MRIELYDKDKKVSSLSIICMFRNNEDYIKNFFVKITNDMEQMYDVHINYYIIENDSRDNTRKLLQDFMATKS